MDYKQALRELKERKDWKELLFSSLEFFKKNKDRYIVRMIVLAYENLGIEKQVLPFWEILAKGENEPETYSSKLANYYKDTGDESNWIKWSRRLILQSLKKKDFDTVEDIWIQLVETKTIHRDLVSEIADKLELLEEKEKAFTLLDIYLVLMENTEPLTRDIIDISKRMLKIDPKNANLRKRLEGYYKKLYSSCSEIENLLDKVNIRRSEKVEIAIQSLEELLNLCPGNYVMHKNWGIGKIESIDLLFNKVYIDFQNHPKHSVDLNLALTILMPLRDDDFNVLRIKNRAFLLSLKDENPIRLIELMLNTENPISQYRAKSLLAGIVEDEEWSDFIKKLKTYSKSKGIEVKGKGKTSFFSLASIRKQTKLSIEYIESIREAEKRIEPLLSIANQELDRKDKQRWQTLTQNILDDENINVGAKINLAFAKSELSGDKIELNNRLASLLEDIQEDDLETILNKLSKKAYKSELLQFIANDRPSLLKIVFLKNTDNWLRALSERILEKKGEIENLHSKVLKTPNKYPFCFLYLLGKIMKTEEKTRTKCRPIILFETLLELVSDKEAGQKTRSKARSVFSKYAFDIYKWVIDTSSEQEIKILLNIIKKSQYVDSQDKKAFARLAETKHPELREETSEEFLYSTKKSLKEKKQELNHLVKTEIPANSKAIGKAARQGDLSENFDYISAKEKQRRLLDRINVLKQELSRARPIEDLEYIEGRVGIGTQITLVDSENNEIREIIILGPWDRHPHKEVVSHTAPIATQLLGKKRGDFFFDKYSKKTFKIVKVGKYNNNI